MRPRDHVALIVLAFLVVASRRPDAILNAQFFAEDGTAWFLDAYQHGGVHVLLLPQAGYLHVIQRLAACGAALLPLRFAPLLFNLVAIACQLLVVSLLVSRRMEPFAPRLRTRLLMGLVYLGLPGSWETHAILSTAHWHLAVFACLLLLVPPAPSRWQRTLECMGLVVAVFSGPLSILLLPVALVRWRQERTPWHVATLIIVAVGAIAQASTVLLTASAERSQVPLGATPGLLSELVGQQIILGSLLGERLFFNLPVVIDRSVLTVTAFAAGTIVLLYALWRAPSRVRLFVAFSLMALAASLATPLVSVDQSDASQWSQLLQQGIGGRYWLLPKLGFLMALVWMLGADGHWLRRGAAKMLLVLLPFGVAFDWAHIPFADLGWAARSSAFEAAPPGTAMEFPIHPGWTLRLTRK